MQLVLNELFEVSTVRIFAEAVDVGDLADSTELNHRDQIFFELTERDGRDYRLLTAAQDESGPSIFQLGLSAGEITPGQMLLRVLWKGLDLTILVDQCPVVLVARHIGRSELVQAEVVGDHVYTFGVAETLKSD